MFVGGQIASDNDAVVPASQRCFAAFVGVFSICFVSAWLFVGSFVGNRVFSTARVVVFEKVSQVLRYF